MSWEVSHWACQDKKNQNQEDSCSLNSAFSLRCLCFMCSYCNRVHVLAVFLQALRSATAPSWGTTNSGSELRERWHWPTIRTLSAESSGSTELWAGEEMEVRNKNKVVSLEHLTGEKEKQERELTVKHSFILFSSLSVVIIQPVVFSGVKLFTLQHFACTLYHDHSQKYYTKTRMNFYTQIKYYLMQVE